jgi:hypothetical protein
MTEEHKILVIYVGVQGIRSEDIEKFVHKVGSRISPQTIEGEFIMIPIQSQDTRIECINPKYITDTELIREHTEMMNKLQEQLRIQLDILKNENNG